MAADLFETYVVTLMSAMLLAYGIFRTSFPEAVTFPLILLLFLSLPQLLALFCKSRQWRIIMGAMYKA